MISKGCIQPLLILLSTQDLTVRRQAAAAMRDLASNLSFKATMAEEGFSLSRFLSRVFVYLSLFNVKVVFSEP
jgi:hypothetical protein